MVFTFGRLMGHTCVGSDKYRPDPKTVQLTEFKSEADFGRMELTYRDTNLHQRRLPISQGTSRRCSGLMPRLCRAALRVAISLSVAHPKLLVLKSRALPIVFQVQSEVIEPAIWVVSVKT